MKPSIALLLILTLASNALAQPPEEIQLTHPLLVAKFPQSQSIVATPAAVLDVANRKDGMPFLTLGRNTAGDGGGNLYVYHARRENITIDGGFYVALDDDQYLEAVDKSVANVKQFGANGILATNQTVQVQAAIDAAMRQNNAVVYFPRGAYTVDALRIPAPTRFVGAGRHKAGLWASPQASGIWIEDTGNAVGFCVDELSFYGQQNRNVTTVLRLGWNQFQWGSGTAITNSTIRDFPEAIGVDINQNISKFDTVTVQGCKTGMRIHGNGVNLSHIQITGTRGLSLDLASPARIYDLEIEAPFSSPTIRVADQTHIFGLHISLAPLDQTGHIETLIQWEKPLGHILGVRLDRSGQGANQGTYGTFLRGAATVAKPSDIFFESALFPVGR